MALSTTAVATSFSGNRLRSPIPTSGGKYTALFGFGPKKSPPSKKKTAKPAEDRIVWFGFGSKKSKKSTAKPAEDGTARFGFGARKSAPPKRSGADPAGERLVWLPGAEPPEWLDGSMIGDRGFDPLGLAKPAEYLQFDFDSLDQNLAKNEYGDVIGTRVETASEVKATPFQPYAEVFGLERFRECELIHGRWAMLGVLGALAVEALTGVAWQDAGKVELVEGSSYLGQPLPFSIPTLIWIEVIAIGYIEFQRNSQLNPEIRLYPGGRFFDPLGLAADPDAKQRLQLAEIKHARLAMIAFLIFALEAAFSGKGPIAFVATFTL